MQAISTGTRKKSARRVRVWGPGSFENEAAMKWVELLEDAPDLDWIEATIDEILELEDAGESPDTGLSCRSIAAAETVAALAERPAEALPEEVRQWCFDNPEEDLAELQPKAVQALGVLLAGSGLREHFETSGDVDGWEAEVEGLRDRLKG